MSYARPAVRPHRQRGEPNGLHLQALLEDGTPADPPRLDTAVPTWRADDTIPLERGKILRVIDVRPGREPDDDALALRPAAFFWAAVPPWRELLRERELEPDFLPPRLDAPAGG